MKSTHVRRNDYLDHSFGGRPVLDDGLHNVSLVAKAQALIPELIPKALEGLQRLSNTNNVITIEMILMVNLRSHTSGNRDNLLDICA